MRRQHEVANELFRPAHDNDWNETYNNRGSQFAQMIFWQCRSHDTQVLNYAIRVVKHRLVIKLNPIAQPLEFEGSISLLVTKI